ncbi:MAG: DUF1786 domain-containing protein [Methanomicrobiales archaeon]|nr:DUF1786 domain-containing protein [Methanomicrobiales archaeon]
MVEPDTLLIIDVGTGTQDILVYRKGEAVEQSPKLVVPSPTVVKAGEISRATRAGRPVFFEGFTMGGGPVTRAIRVHLQAGHAVYATEEAARTFHDNLEKARAVGIKIVDTPPEDAIRVMATDFMELELRETFARFGIPFPRKYAFAVQDHGFSPERSNRAFRFELLQESLEGGNWHLDALVSDPPREEMTRMRSLRTQAPDSLVMDTGPAALVGMLCDPWVREKAGTGVVLVNVGNGHTLSATVRGETVCGLFEHHTFSLTPEKLGSYLKKLCSGTLTNEEIFQAGGHGAAVHVPLDAETIVATGPNRRMLLPHAYQAAPFGDMMLTGCFGVLREWKRLRE